jgi:hypothetical protein
MIRFECSACGKKLKAPDGSGGKPATCPRCKRRFNVPSMMTDPFSQGASSADGSGDSAGQSKQSPRRPVTSIVEFAREVEPVDNSNAAESTSVPSHDKRPLVELTDDGTVRVNATTIIEAKLALIELRIVKKQLALAKRLVMKDKREIRAAYTDYVRRRGSKAIGGGTIGRIFRIVQTVNRDMKKVQLANALAPREEQQSRLETMITSVDFAILQVQKAILSGPTSI